ncbi:hypothetical protein ACYSNR_13740 [Enterococcus sp. LJL128]|uniref:hypothetical protein n=1 Tax=Enterococcus sp. LJL51 TaxID=3416656 RepID=UPI003CF52C87
MNYWIFFHKASQREAYVFDEKTIVSDKLDEKSNWCPYIWSKRFRATNCKESHLMKANTNDIIFYVIPEPRPKNIKGTYVGNYFYCDLVFIVDERQEFDKNNLPQVLDDPCLNYFHYKLGKEQHNKRIVRNTLIAKESSFQPQINNKLVDLLTFKNQGLEEELNSLHDKVRNGARTNLEVVNIQNDFGDKLFELLAKNDDIEKVKPYNILGDINEKISINNLRELKISDISKIYKKKLSFDAYVKH